MTSPRHRHSEPSPPRGNLTRLARDYTYRIEMVDGELLTGALVDVTVTGIATVRLRDGALVERPCERMARLTELEHDPAGPPA
jgi:hypothetical protein